MLRLIVPVTVALLFASAALAQDNGARPEERRVVYDMDAEVIEGGLDRPDTVVLPAPVKRKFRSLIQIRKEFRREVLATASAL